MDCVDTGNNCTSDLSTAVTISSSTDFWQLQRCEEQLKLVCFFLYRTRHTNGREGGANTPFLGVIFFKGTFWLDTLHTVHIVSNLPSVCHPSISKVAFLFLLPIYPLIFCPVYLSCPYTCTSIQIRHPLFPNASQHTLHQYTILHTCTVSHPIPITVCEYV